MDKFDKDIYERALKREKAARKSAEKILETKSNELYVLSEKLKITISFCYLSIYLKAAKIVDQNTKI